MIQLMMELVDLASERCQLSARIFVLPQARDGLGDLVRIHLRGEIDVDHDRFAFQSGLDALIEDEHESGRIGFDLVAGQLEVVDDGDALQVDGHLLQGVPLGPLRGQSDGIFLRVTVAHPIFAVGRDRAELRMGRQPAAREEQEQGEGDKGGPSGGGRVGAASRCAGSHGSFPCPWINNPHQHTTETLVCLRTRGRPRFADRAEPVLPLPGVHARLAVAAHG